MKGLCVLMQAVGVCCLAAFPVGTAVGVLLIAAGAVGYRREARRVKCPFCRRRIEWDALACGYCGRDLPEEFVGAGDRRWRRAALMAWGKAAALLAPIVWLVVWAIGHW